MLFPISLLTSSKFPIYKQFDRRDCGPTCLRMIAKHYGRTLDPEFLRQKSGINREGVSIAGLAQTAESIGFHTLAVSVDFDTFREQMPLPAIAYWRERHFVVVYGIDKHKVYVADPGYGKISYTHEEFLKGWLGKDNEAGEGFVLAMEPTDEFHGNQEDSPRKRGRWGHVLQYVKPYRSAWVQLIIGLVVASILQLFLPFLTQSIVDTGIRYEDIGFIYLVLIAQIGLTVSQLVVQVLRDWLLLYMTSRINISMLSDFLIKLMSLPLSFFDTKHVGDIMQRISDQQRIRALISSNSLNIIFSTLNILVFGVVLFLYSKLILLVFTIGSLIYVGWTLIFLKKRAEIDYRRFDESAGNQSSLVQIINGMKSIKLNGSELRRRWEWEAIQARLFRISIKSLSLNQTQISGGVFINELKNIVITFIAAVLVIEGELTLGMMLSVQYIIGQLNLPVNNFISFTQTLQDAKISVDRLAEVKDLDSEEAGNENVVYELPNDRSIYLKNVSFQYGSMTSPMVLKHINLKIESGKTTAIVGPSGSGKTTLVKLLLNFYQPTGGNIRIGKRDLDRISPRFWRSQCGAVMQDGFIFSDTIARNVSESDSNNFLIDREKLRYAVKMANIEEFIESLPNGYSTRIGASGMSLSGGQNQRIQIARAVYKDPEYLFFDEATSALDASNESTIMKNLNRVWEDKTVVVVAHRLSTVKNADNIVVLHEGEIIETGTHEELVAKRSFYFRLVKDQLELGE